MHKIRSIKLYFVFVWKYKYIGRKQYVEIINRLKYFDECWTDGEQRVFDFLSLKENYVF
jgi:hypothetical protein